MNQDEAPAKTQGRNPFVTGLGLLSAGFGVVAVAVYWSDGPLAGPLFIASMFFLAVFLVTGGICWQLQRR